MLALLHATYLEDHRALVNYGLRVCSILEVLLALGHPMQPIKHKDLS